MLVLSRKKNESIAVTLGGEQLTLTLVDIRGDKVRLGFTAAKEIKILRSELEPGFLPHPANHLCRDRRTEKRE